MLLAPSCNPLVHDLDALITEGDVSGAETLAAEYASARIDEIAARVFKSGLPRDGLYMPCAGDCLGPSIPDGMIAVMDPGGAISPSSLVLFQSDDTRLLLGKVYLGLSTDDQLAQLFKPPFEDDTYAVFWFEQPGAIMGVPLCRLLFLAPVAGFINLEGIYRKGAWAFDNDQVPFIADVMRFIEPVPIAGFGEPPLVTRAAA